MVGTGQQSLLLANLKSLRSCTLLENLSVFHILKCCGVHKVYSDVPDLQRFNLPGASYMADVVVVLFHRVYCKSVHSLVTHPRRKRWQPTASSRTAPIIAFALTCCNESWSPAHFDAVWSASRTREGSKAAQPIRKQHHTPPVPRTARARSSGQQYTASYGL